MLRDIWLSTVGVLSITVMSLCLVSTPALTGKARAEVIRLTFNQFNPALEPLGFGLLQDSMGRAALSAFPDYNGGCGIAASNSRV